MARVHTKYVLQAVWIVVVGHDVREQVPLVRGVQIPLVFRTPVLTNFLRSLMHIVSVESQVGTPTPRNGQARLLATNPCVDGGLDSVVDWIEYVLRPLVVCFLAPLSSLFKVLCDFHHHNSFHVLSVLQQYPS